VGDLERLLDPPEEQLDLPATFVQAGDLLCLGSQIIGEQAQYLAGVDPDLDFANQPTHGVLARGGKPLGKVADMIAEDRRSHRNRAIFNDLKGGVALEAGDDAAAGPMQPRPPAVVVVAEVEDISRSRLDRHLLGSGDVVDALRRHHEIKRLVGIGIVDDVGFDTANPGRKPRPTSAQAAQSDAGRVDQPHTIADLAPIATMQLRHQRRKQRAKHFSWTRLIGRRQRRSRNRAAAQMVKLAGMAAQAGFDVAQTARPAKLGKQHGNQMRLGPQGARIPLSLVFLHKFVVQRPRNMLQECVKDDILMLHGLDPFSCPVIRNHLELE